MSPFNTARDIYLALCCDQNAEAEIREEKKNLALAIATDPNKSFELTSSTVNGQSMAGTRTMTNHDRLKMLTLVCKMFDAGYPVSSKAKPIF